MPIVEHTATCVVTIPAGERSGENTVTLPSDATYTGYSVNKYSQYASVTGSGATKTCRIVGAPVNTTEFGLPVTFTLNYTTEEGEEPGGGEPPPVTPNCTITLKGTFAKEFNFKPTRDQLINIAIQSYSPSGATIKLYRYVSSNGVEVMQADSSGEYWFVVSAGGYNSAVSPHFNLTITEPQCVITLKNTFTTEWHKQTPAQDIITAAVQSVTPSNATLFLTDESTNNAVQYLTESGNYHVTATAGGYTNGRSATFYLMITNNVATWVDTVEAYVYNVTATVSAPNTNLPATCLIEMRDEGLEANASWTQVDLDNSVAVATFPINRVVAAGQMLKASSPDGNISVRVEADFPVVINGGGEINETAPVDRTYLTANEVKQKVINNYLIDDRNSSTDLVIEVVPTAAQLNVNQSATYNVTAHNSHYSNLSANATTIRLQPRPVEIVLQPSITTTFDYGTSDATIINANLLRKTPSNATVGLYIKRPGGVFERVFNLREYGNYWFIAAAKNYRDGYSTDFGLKVRPTITMNNEISVSRLDTLSEIDVDIKTAVGTTPMKIWTIDGVQQDDEYVCDLEGTFDATLQVRDSHNPPTSSVVKSFRLNVTPETIDATVIRGFPPLSTRFHSSAIGGSILAGADVSAAGNALKIDYQFPSSIVAGYQKAKQEKNNMLFYAPQGVKYTDAYGRFNNFGFDFAVYNEIISFNDVGEKSSNLPECAEEDFGAVLFTCPYLEYHKDGGNTHALTYQLNFLARYNRSSRVVVGYRFVEKLLNFNAADAANDNARNVWFSNEIYTKFENRKPKGAIQSGVTLATEIVSNNIYKYVKIQLNGTFASIAAQYKSFAVADGHNNLLFAYNMENPFNASDRDYAGVVYFNFLHRRPEAS